MRRSELTMFADTAGRWPRRRRTINGAAIAIAIAALLLGRLRHFTPTEAVRIARAAVADRDPSFPRDAIVVTVDAMEVNVGDPRMSRWDVVLKRRDDLTGYLVEVD